VVFPLAPGPFEIGPARVTYSVPVTTSFLSREVRHEPQSDPIPIEVLPQPDVGRPGGFSGAAGAAMSLTFESSAEELSVGDAGLVAATVAGRGNVALWPEPAFVWPAGLRVYPEGVDIELARTDGLVGGIKRFRYLVVADSAGTHRIPAASYAYFDLDAMSYRSIGSPSLALSSAGPMVPVIVPPRAVMPQLTDARGLGLDRLASLPWWVVAVAFVLPPLAVALSRVRIRRPWRGPRSPEPPEGSLQRLEAQLRVVLSGLVPHATTGDGEVLADALRAAGVEEPVAAHAARVRDRLWQSSYGPEGEVDPDELAEEVKQVLRALGGEQSSSPMSGVAVAGLLLLCANPLAAQSAERLFQAGAYRSAADSFRARTVAEPWQAGHWYNLGVALEYAGRSGEARAAWVRAARSGPRNSAVRSVQRSLPTSDPVTRRLTWVSPVTSSEAWMVAFVLWLVGWAVVGLHGRRRWAMGALVLAAVSGAYGAYVAAQYRRPVALVNVVDAPLRSAPYGAAQATRQLADGSAVVVQRSQGRWVLVERGDARGWLLRDEITPL
jgi:hypothetical protein